MDSYKDKYLALQMGGGQIGGSDEIISITKSQIIMDQQIMDKQQQYENFILSYDMFKKYYFNEKEKVNKYFEEAKEKKLPDGIFNSRNNTYICSYNHAVMVASEFIHKSIINFVSKPDYSSITNIPMIRDIIYLDRCIDDEKRYTAFINTMSLENLYNYFAIPENSRGYELINDNNKYIIFLQHHFMLMVFLYNESKMKEIFTNTLQNIEELCITYIKKYKNVRNFLINKSITNELNYINENNSGKFKNLIAVIGFLEFYKTEEVNILVRFKYSINGFKKFIRIESNKLNNSLKKINKIRKEKNIDPFPDTIYNNIDFKKPCNYNNTIMQANKFLMYNYDDLKSYIIDNIMVYFEELNNKLVGNQILTIYKSIIDNLNISDLHKLFLIPKTIELNDNNKYIISLQHYFISIVFLYYTIDIKVIFTNTLKNIQELCISLLKNINPDIPDDTYTNSINIKIYDKLEYIIRTEDDTYFNDDIKFTNLIAVFGFIEYYKSK